MRKQVFTDDPSLSERFVDVGKNPRNLKTVMLEVRRAKARKNVLLIFAVLTLVLLGLLLAPLFNGTVSVSEIDLVSVLLLVWLITLCSVFLLAFFGESGELKQYDDRIIQDVTHSDEIRELLKK